MACAASAFIPATYRQNRYATLTGVQLVFHICKSRTLVSITTRCAVRILTKRHSRGRPKAQSHKTTASEQKTWIKRRSGRSKGRTYTWLWRLCPSVGVKFHEKERAYRRSALGCCTLKGGDGAGQRHKTDTSKRDLHEDEMRSFRWCVDHFGW